MQLSSLSLEPDVTDLSVDAGVFELELSRHGSRQGSRSNSRHPSIHGSASCWRPGQNEHLALCHAAVPSFLTRKVLDWSWPQGLAETQVKPEIAPTALPCVSEIKAHEVQPLEQCMSFLFHRQSCLVTSYMFLPFSYLVHN